MHKANVAQQHNQQDLGIADLERQMRPSGQLSPGCRSPEFLLRRDLKWSWGLRLSLCGVTKIQQLRRSNRDPASVKHGQLLRLPEPEPEP